MEDRDDKKPHAPLKERFDVRIVSLYSRDTQNGPRFEKLTQPNQYYTYSYYDAIWVDRANIGEQTMFKSAYEQGVKIGRKHRPKMFQQVFLVFSDIVPEGANNAVGYSAREISKFWRMKKYGLFFMTMINVKEPRDLSETMKLIHDSFPKDRHMAYLTFDHCNIVVFTRTNSFREYAKLVCQLDYTHPNTIMDSITIYAFAQGEHSTKRIKEKFPVLVSLGIRDYAQYKQFEKAVRGQDEENVVTFSWLLGRNDVAIYHPNATVTWLSTIKRMAEENSGWYTTYDLTVLIEPSRIDSASIVTPPPKRTKLIQQRMEEAYQEFSENYIRVCKKKSCQPDLIWLRWLGESSKLAASLAESSLSMDFGTCLTPQFFDFFTYTKKLFSVKDLDSFEMSDTRSMFAEFFSNISVLIDSMNHSNRQFVQVPSFHSVSFEIPPRIMAYYTAMAHLIIKTLHDDNDNADYGLTIAPKYVDELEVRSISLPDAAGLEHEQFIAMNIAEQSLYTLQITTETMAHEISHFVGQKVRCRGLRKECILQCALHEMIADLTLSVRMDVLDEYILPDRQDLHKEDLRIQASHLSICVEKIWEKLKEMPEFREIEGCSEGDYGDEVQEVLYNLPDTLYSIPSLSAKVTEQITSLLFTDEDFQNYILRYSAIEAGGDPKSLAASCWAETAKYKIWLSVQKKLKEYALAVRGLLNRTAGEEYITAFGKTYKFRRLYDAFRETFADLQAILIFEMNFSMYCDLLKRSDELLCDLQSIPNRIVAVGRVLKNAGFWRENTIQSNDPELEKIVEAIRLSSYSVEDLHAMDLGLDYNLLRYLEKYLESCRKKIEGLLNDNKRQPLVVELRSMFAVLSDESTVIDLSTKMMEFINYYRDSLREKRCL